MAKRKKIFLVEDTESMRAGYKAALEAAGHEVVDFASIPEAFGAWHDHAATTDLILSDHHLGYGSSGSMYGTEMLSFARHRRFNGPFLLMSTEALEMLQQGKTKEHLEADRELSGCYSAFVRKEWPKTDNVVAAVAEAFAAVEKSAAPAEPSETVVVEGPARAKPPRHSAARARAKTR